MDKPAQNNLNLLRLLFAWLVIVGHSYDLVDGNFAREPMNYLFGTIPSHYLAVNAFFVISGYLIAKSWHYDPCVTRFLQRRVARIVPGFLCCVLICIGFYSFLYDHDYLSRFNWPTFLAKMTLLQSGGLPPAFPDSRYPVLNQSLWTIHYEFLCYIGLMLLGKYQLLRSRLVLPACVAMVLCHIGYLLLGNLLWQQINGGHEPGFMYYLINWVRFAGCYLAGVAWMQHEDRIRKVSAEYPLVVFGLFLLTLAISPLHLVATTLLLVPLLSYLAFNIPAISGFWLKNDISYGLYLYAWPVQKIIMASTTIANPLLLILLSSLGGGLLGWLSWIAVERPALKLLRP